MKIIILILITSVLMSAGGYYLGRAINSSQKPQAQVTDSPVHKNKVTLSNQPIKISKNDFKEYQQLKSQKEKYNKANEILQKILKVFLLDLGLRISDDNLALIKSNLDKPINKNNSITSNEQNTPIKSSDSLPDTTKTQAIVGSKKWIENENKTSEISTEDEAQAFLKSVEIKDFFKSLKFLTPINKKRANHIFGSFWGKAHVHIKNKDVVWDVEMEIIDTSEGRKLSADTTIKMFQDGKRFSKSTGNGEFKNFKGLAGSELAIITDTYGGDGYFQLYKVDRLNALIGNYYHKQSIGNFKKVGTVYLEPR